MRRRWHGGSICASFRNDTDYLFPYPVQMADESLNVVHSHAGPANTPALKIEMNSPSPKRLSVQGFVTETDDPTELLMFLDFTTYLPDDILVKVDRASMAVSLEARTPFLDHRVVELAWSLPLSMKIRDDRGKWILRRLLKRYLPEELVEREKQGFGLPLAAWLRGPLRDWAESLLANVGEPFDAAQIQTLWRAHLGGANRESAIWTVLMYQAWVAQR